MNKSLFTLVVVMAAGGCSTEERIYGAQPLVAKVETGMSKEQVQQIGGQPVSITDRTVEPGTCFDYLLTQAGQHQPYNVSFNGNGKVDHKSFMTCMQWSRMQERNKEPAHSGGGY
jgi:osmotically inducible lipoprotein OsmE